MAVETGLSLALSETTKTGFVASCPNFSLHVYFQALKAREKLLEKIETCINSLQGGDCPNILAFLYPLCAAGNLDRASLKYICLDLLFASHETTTSAACFLLLYLSRNEMILSRLEEELRQNDIYAKGKQHVHLFYTCEMIVN